MLKDIVNFILEYNFVGFSLIVGFIILLIFFFIFHQTRWLFTANNFTSIDPLGRHRITSKYMNR